MKKLITATLVAISTTHIAASSLAEYFAQSAKKELEAAAQLSTEELVTIEKILDTVLLSTEYTDKDLEESLSTLQSIIGTGANSEAKAARAAQYIDDYIALQIGSSSEEELAALANAIDQNLDGIEDDLRDSARQIGTALGIPDDKLDDFARDFVHAVRTGNRSILDRYGIYIAGGAGILTVLAALTGADVAIDLASKKPAKSSSTKKMNF